MVSLSSLKEKYGFKEKLVNCDYNDINYRDGDKNREYVDACTLHLEDPPVLGEKVITFQGDDSVWIRGIVATEPVGDTEKKRYFKELGYTFEVDLDKDDFDCIDEETFSEWIR
jgi:hypothetical protein